MTNLREALKAAVTKHCHVNMKWPATAQLDDSHVDAFLTEVSAALSAPVGEPVAFYVCYDGYGDHFISRERPTHHTAVCYDEDTAEEITKILNRDSQPSPGWDEATTGDLFNQLIRRINFDGMDPRTFTLGELERAIEGAAIDSRTAVEEMKIAAAIDPEKRIGNCEGGFPITGDACEICGATYADRCGRRAALRSGGAEKSDGGERCLSANETRLVEQAVIDSGEVIETLPGPSDTPARDGDEA